MGTKQLHIPALLSMLSCAALVLIGVLRVMSYSRDTWLAAVAGSPFLSIFAYEPTSYVSAQFFKILATPSAIAVVYFLIRLRNRSYRRMSPLSYNSHGGRLDFKSPWLRFALTAIVSLHWVVMETIKHYSEDFYPFSSLESTGVNAAVLLVSGVAAFWGMKYLSFDPLFEHHESK